jgi:hypothetical protein
MKSIFDSSYLFVLLIFKTEYDYNSWSCDSNPHEAFRIYPDNYIYQFKLKPEDVKKDIPINDLNYSIINY